MLGYLSLSLTHTLIRTHSHRVNVIKHWRINILNVFLFFYIDLTMFKCRYLWLSYCYLLLTALNVHTVSLKHGFSLAFPPLTATITLKVFKGRNSWVKDNLHRSIINVHFYFTIEPEQSEANRSNDRISGAAGDPWFRSWAFNAPQDSRICFHSTM